MRKNPTQAEQKLWEALRLRRLDNLHFRRQRPIGSFIVDFYCEAGRLGIEIDGDIHDEDNQKEYDAIRTELLELKGIRMIRFPNEEVIHNLSDVLKKIREAVHSPPPRTGEGLGVGARNAERPGVEAIEILVIDNHSQDESIQWLRNRLRNEPLVRILESSENKGYAGGNAVAIAQAKGTYLLIVNPDNTLEPGALKMMVDAMENDPSIGIVAPKLVHEDGTVRDSVRRFPSPLDVLAKRSLLRKPLSGRVRRYTGADEDMDRQRDVDWAVGACLLIRRDFYAELGGFDERFFLFFEDMDLCRRCRNAGKRVVYIPAAVARDRKQRLSEGGVWGLLTKRSGRIHVASAVKYFWKWGLRSS